MHFDNMHSNDNMQNIAIIICLAIYITNFINAPVKI